MPVNIIQYRGAVGIFNCSMFVKESNIKKIALNLNDKFYNDSALVVCNNGLFGLLFLSVLLFLKHFASKSAKHHVSIFLFTLIHSWVGIWLYTRMISLSGDVVVNPGQRTKASDTFSVYHWNSNSISAHNFSKVSRLTSQFINLA